jgi:hypothetical protein
LHDKHSQNNRSGDKKEPISFIAIVPKGETLKFSERIKANGTIESLRIRFFTGQQKSLHVRPYIKHKGNKIEDLITYPDGTDQYVSGDDDYLDFPLVVAVENDDEIVVWAQNTDLADDYTLHVSVMVDYYGSGGVTCGHSRVCFLVGSIQPRPIG